MKSNSSNTKTKDTNALKDITVFKNWLRTNLGITTWEQWRQIPKAQRSDTWLRFQQQRWGFTHYVGDKCPPDGHAEKLLCWLDKPAKSDVLFKL